MLELAVAAWVFVAEAARDLEVAFKARDHEELLQLLWRLRQGVEGAGRRAAWHQEVPGALRRALDQDGRFHLHKVARVQEVAHVFDHAVPQDNVVVHGGGAQVQVSILKTDQLIYLAGAGDFEGRRLGRVEYLRNVGEHLHLAGGQVRVLSAGGPRGHLALHKHHPLGPERLGHGVGLGRALRVEHHLDYAPAVPQVYECESAVVPPTVYPAGQCHLGPGVAFTKVAT